MFGMFTGATGVYEALPSKRPLLAEAAEPKESNLVCLFLSAPRHVTWAAGGHLGS